MKEIQLTQGKVALVDDEDFELLSGICWGARKGKSGTFYAQATINKQLILMHRFILNAPKGFDVDHQNGNGLDNRRENIRICTRTQNLWNSRVRGVIPFKGVSLLSNSKKFRAQIRINKEKVYLGLYDTAIEAAMAYDAKAIEIQGEFARLNFPKKISS